MSPGGAGEPALIGREADCRAIDALLDAARSGRGAALLLRGEAGIGKTALLGYAVGRARGMTVLAARGIESESEIPFSGLSELLRPLLDRLEMLPARQAAALASALAIGPPVGGDRFAIAAATLSLLASASTSGPLLVVVDDLHWLDTSSAEAVLFAARRLDAEPAALLFAARDEVSARFGDVAIPERRIAGLDRTASLALLAAAGAGRIAADVAERLVRETRGNPLALVEIPRLVSEGQLAGSDDLEAPVPVGERIEQAFSCRIAGLPGETRRALVVAAASDSRELDVILRAVRELGLRAQALEPAEAAGLVAIGDLELEFRHPLVRSCVYYTAPAARLRAAHAALARALSRRGDELADRRAWHLAAAALEPDEEVAAALESAAVSALRRSGYPAAARTFERAARLSPDAHARARRLFAAAQAWHLANRSERAIGLLEDAASLAGEPLLRAEIQHLRARIDIWRGPALDAFRLLCAEADRLETLAPDRAASMLADATLSAITGGELARAVQAARRAHAIAGPLGGAMEVVTALQLGKALILTGDARAGYPLIMRVGELFDAGDPLQAGQAVAECAPALMAVEEYELADRLLGAVISAGRTANALGLLQYCLGAQSELDARVGHWASAYANGFESIDLAREAGQSGQLSYNLARLARVEAAQGREESCRAHAAEALELARTYDFGSAFPFAESALGLLELGLGRLDAAVEHLLSTQELWERAGFREPGRLEWEPDLAEALIRAGRRDEALATLERLEREANLRPAAAEPAGGWSGCTLARAAALRCRGLLAPEDGMEALFDAARGWHARTATPF